MFKPWCCVSRSSARTRAYVRASWLPHQEEGGEALTRTSASRSVSWRSPPRSSRPRRSAASVNTSTITTWSRALGLTRLRGALHVGRKRCSECCCGGTQGCTHRGGSSRCTGARATFATRALALAPRALVGVGGASRRWRTTAIGSSRSHAVQCCTTYVYGVHLTFQRRRLLSFPTDFAPSSSTCAGAAVQHAADPRDGPPGLSTGRNGGAAGGVPVRPTHHSRPNTNPNTRRCGVFLAAGCRDGTDDLLYLQSHTSFLPL